jgi:hypothetical protein
MIRASDYAVPAADAAWVNVRYDPVVLVPRRRVDGADESAWSMVGRVAVHAWTRQERISVIGVIFAVVQLEY